MIATPQTLGLINAGIVPIVTECTRCNSILISYSTKEKELFLSKHKFLHSQIPDFEKGELIPPFIKQCQMNDLVIISYNERHIAREVHKHQMEKAHDPHKHEFWKTVRFSMDPEVNDGSL